MTIGILICIRCRQMYRYHGEGKTAEENSLCEKCLRKGRKKDE